VAKAAIFIQRQIVLRIVITSVTEAAIRFVHTSDAGVGRMRCLKRVGQLASNGAVLWTGASTQLSLRERVYTATPAQRLKARLINRPLRYAEGLA
jgi:hypothetical protein